MERCRITTRQGAVYIVEQSVGHVADLVFSGQGLVALDTVVGYEIMPSEHLVIRTDEIVSVQSMSAENWAMQQETEERHYRQYFGESPQEKVAEALQRMADIDHD